MKKYEFNVKTTSGGGYIRVVIEADNLRAAELQAKALYGSALMSGGAGRPLL